MPIRRLCLIFSPTAGIFNKHFKTTWYDSNWTSTQTLSSRGVFLFFPGCSRMLFVFQDEHRNAHQQTLADAVNHTWVTFHCVSLEKWSQNLQRERGAWLWLTVGENVISFFFFLSSRKSLLQKLLTIKWLNARSRKDGWTEAWVDRNRF